MSNNDLLAGVYCAGIMQLVVVFPLVWKHLPQGDWFVFGTFEDEVTVSPLAYES